MPKSRLRCSTLAFPTLLADRIMLARSSISQWRSGFDPDLRDTTRSRDLVVEPLASKDKANTVVFLIHAKNPLGRPSAARPVPHRARDRHRGGRGFGIMDPRLLSFYNDELAYLREGREFG